MIIHAALRLAADAHPAARSPSPRYLLTDRTRAAGLLVFWNPSGRCGQSKPPPCGSACSIDSSFIGAADPADSDRSTSTAP
jgi:hypothetical protein